MGNRDFMQYLNSPIKGLTLLHARVSIGASGDPTLQKFTPPYAAVAGAFSAAPTSGVGNYAIGTEGVKSIAKVSTGVYTIVLQDSYVRLLCSWLSSANGTGLPTAMDLGVWTTGTDVTSRSAPTIKITTMSATATAAEPASGDVLDFVFLLSSSTALG